MDPGAGGQEGKDFLEEVVPFQDVWIKSLDLGDQGLQDLLLSQIGSPEGPHGTGRGGQHHGQESVAFRRTELEAFGHVGNQMHLHPAQIAQGHSPEEGATRVHQVQMHGVCLEELR